jgi:hypothetical protein
MQNLRAVAVAFAMALLCALVVPNARADEWNKKTILTFSAPVEIPGKVLPAGSYTFQLLDSPADRHIVQVFDKDMHLITTVLAVPNERLKPTDDTVIRFAERPADQPVAIRAWFYPGDNMGQEFVYPKQRAVELAKATNETIPSYTSDDTSATGLRSATITEVTPQSEVAANPPAETQPMTQPTQTQPSPEQTTTATQTTTTQEPTTPMTTEHRNEKLPSTASPIPLIALLGMLSLGAALGLRLIVKARS